MIVMLQFTTLVMATMFALVAAAALNWLCLRAAFFLMQPATARRIASARIELARGTTPLAHGTAQLARAYASHR